MDEAFESLIPLIWPEGPKNFWAMVTLLCVLGVVAYLYLWQRKR